MSQVITDAFSSYWQQCLIDQTPVVLDEFVLAHIPGLDPDAPISPASGLPPAEQVVHRHVVDQRGRINNDAVAYSIVMDTTVGDFTFNAMYLINSALNLVGMIVHKGEETKLRTDPAIGQTGNSLVKSMLMEYDRAAEASQTVIDASTWQIDYAARLRGMDEDLRRQAMGTFGHAAFYGDGFKLVSDAGLYKVQPGQGYVGGLLVELSSEQEVIPSAKPVGLWLDVYRAGALLSPWVNHVTLTLSTTDLVDYVDASGYPHFVTRLATINSDDSVTDTRAKRTLSLTGDVNGQADFNGPDSIELEVHIEDNSHAHTIENVAGLQAALDDKSPEGHTHTPAEVGAAPAGYGLGGAVILDEPDLNLYPNGAGFYLTVDSPLNRPDPTLSGRWYVLVEGQVNYVKQTASSVGAKYGTSYSRVRNSTTLEWDAWVATYSTANPPTAADVGAAPAGFGIGEGPIQKDPNTLHVGGLWRDTATGYAGITLPFDGTPSSRAIGVTSTGGLRAAARGTDNVYVWKKIYSEVDKPTPADVGAVAKAGDVMTGALNISYNGGTGAMSIDAASGDFVVGNAAGAAVVYQDTSEWHSHAAVFPSVQVSNAPTAAAELTRKDYVDTHTWTAAAGNADIVAGSYGQVGTYALLHSDAGATSIDSTHSGSSLHPADAEGYSSGSMSGTWKQLGHRSVTASDNTGSETTLFIRIA